MSEAALLARLRARDGAVYSDLICEWSPCMLRVARRFVASEQAAEDVVQETWLVVIAGLARFEGRSALRTWVFSILINRARSLGSREARTIPWSQLATARPGPALDPDVHGPEPARPGGWTSMTPVALGEHDPERHAIDGELRAVIDAALAELPERQRMTVTLRDLLGMDSEETCRLLGVTPHNQRVLLHRGRSALRRALDPYYRAA